MTENWRPIETAPKDLTEVLVYSPINGVLVAQFEHRAIEPHWNYDVHDLVPSEHTEVQQPTHWMPMPDEPKAGE